MASGNWWDDFKQGWQNFWNGGYQQVGGSSDQVAADTRFLDPTGAYKSAMDSFLSGSQGPTGGGTSMPVWGMNGDPTSAMNQFLSQGGQLTDFVSGATGPVAQMLQDIATKQAKVGGEAALAAMPGGMNSGAGMAAFGDAYAKPFADVAAQLGQTQLAMLSPLLQGSQSQGYDWMKQGNQNAFDWSRNVYDQNAARQNMYAQLYGSMAGKTGEFYTPTYEATKGAWDKLMDAGNLAIRGGSALATGGLSEVVK